MNVMSTADDAWPGSRYWTSSCIPKLSVWSVARVSLVPLVLLPHAKTARPPTTARANTRKRILFIKAPFCVLLSRVAGFAKSDASRPLALFPHESRGESAPTRGGGHQRCAASIYSGHHYCFPRGRSQVPGEVAPWGLRPGRLGRMRPPGG